MKTRKRAALLLCVVLAAWPTLASADEERGLAWGLLATEASTAGIIALGFGLDGWPSDGPGLALNFLPALIGPGAGYLGHRADWDPRPAYAIHGASMMGLDLFMLGAMIDGRNEQDGLRVGATAWTLGALGAVAGGWLGATDIDGSREGVAFFTGPTGGLLVGGLLIGGAAALATEDSNMAGQRFVLGGTIGLSLGLAGSLFYARRHDASREPTASFPTIEAGPHRALFSLAGVF